METINNNSTMFSLFCPLQNIKDRSSTASYSASFFLYFWAYFGVSKYSFIACKLRFKILNQSNLLKNTVWHEIFIILFFKLIFDKNLYIILINYTNYGIMLFLQSSNTCNLHIYPQICITNKKLSLDIP